jgi:predicted AAA+ superfamily ATPase
MVDAVKKRLEGLDGDPVIQIQTPFGGGKTHALIALYHNAEHWNAKRVVISGTSMGPTETLWEAIEKQLTGKTTGLAENVTPGRDALRINQPLS